MTPHPSSSPPAALRRCLAAACTAGLAVAAAQVWAQTAADGPAVAPVPGANSAAAPAAGTPPTARGEPSVQQRVLQDEHIIIEELVVRGQPVRISVRGTTPGARAYEVNVGPGGRDPSQDSGRAGQSAWRLFSF